MSIFAKNGGFVTAERQGQERFRWRTTAPCSSTNYEFQRGVLEALREPLETGHIHIARAARRAEFPARFQLVAAMNPCPCGWLGHGSGKCRCTPDQVARYRCPTAPARRC